MPPLAPLLLRRRRAPVRAWLVGLAAASLLIAVPGCGEDAPPVAKLSQTEVEEALATPVPGQPAPMKAIEQEAGQVIVPEGDPVQTLDARVAELRGTPVVVNLWGDWCVPCRKEMPIFQRVALSERGKIAFIGVAVNSPKDKAEAYLRDEVFVPYPSILDEDGKVNVGTGVDNLPKTFFYDRSGKRVVHIGPYESEADLLADIERYAS